MNSYHVFVLSYGREGVERVHIAYTGQTRDEAERRLKPSQRKRIIGYRLARPTEHYREEIAAREAREIDPEAIQVAIASGKRRRVVYRDK